MSRAIEDGIGLGFQGADAVFGLLRPGWQALEIREPASDRRLGVRSRNPTMDTRSKILSAQQAAKIASSWASHGRIVAAHGWFDILRAEHCRALTDAKQKGKHLMVALYGDSDSHATVVDESSRAQLVAALAAVDSVVICDEAEAASLIASWQPAAIVDAEQAITSDLIHDVLQRHRPA